MVRAPKQNGLIVGRYALHGEIASGGMATVHFGRLMGPAGFRRVVAIKRLHPQLAKEQEFVSMFLDEVRLAGRIQHPNVVTTLDAVYEGKELFLVMEYVHGESLARLIRLARSRGKQIPPAIATTIICGVLHGLHAAHEAKTEGNEPLDIVHRDVSPQNVLVGFDGVARVLDFGIAKAAGRLQTTREGQIKGKMSYLAPEHVRGGTIDRRSDIYGVAVVLWEALTGVRLFDGENDAIVLAKVLAGEVTPPSVIAPEVPAPLEAIVMRSLDRDPEARFSTARDMALALQREVGVVAPCEVADWISGLAEDHLSTRSLYLAELEKLSFTEKNASESGTASSRPREGSSDAIAVLPLTATFNDIVGAPVRRKRFRRPLLAVALLACALAIGAFATKVSQPAAAYSGPRFVALDPPEPLRPTPSPVLADAIVELGPSLPAAPPAHAVHALPKLVSKPAARAAPRPVAPLSSRESAAPAPPSSESVSLGNACHPPFTIDAAGIKRFKLECL